MVPILCQETLEQHCLGQGCIKIVGKHLAASDTGTKGVIHKNSREFSVLKNFYNDHSSDVADPNINGEITFILISNTIGLFCTTTN